MRCHFFHKQNVVPYNYHCIGRGYVHFSAPAGPRAASFSLQNAMCDGSKCAVFSSLFLSLGGTGCDVAREVETACRLCFSPRLQIDVYLPLFCANWSSDAVKGACFHRVFTGPLGDRREVKFRRTALRRALWCSRSDFPPYLMSTLWRWWQPHPIELPDSWGA